MSKAFRDIFIVNEDYMNIRNAVNVLSLLIKLIPNKKENANELINSISNCYDKFKDKYEDSIIIERYRGILVNNFMNSGNLSGINLNNGKDKSETQKEDRKRKKDRSRDNNNKRNNDKKKSPDNYKKYRN